METIIYQHENRHHYVCKIVETEDAYKLMVQNKQKEYREAYFDKRAKVLRAVIDEIEKSGHPRFGTWGVEFSRKERRKTVYCCTLAQVVYSALFGIKRDELKNHRVMFKSDDVFDYRKKNLVWTSLKVDKVTLVGCEYIRLRSKTSSGEYRFAITNLDEELYSILRNTPWHYDDNKQNFYTSKSSDRWKCTLPQLVYAVFRCGATRENWREVVDEMRASFHKDEEMSIDHKQVSGNALGKFDNRIENLQVIPYKLNNIKHNCTKKLLPNCFFIPTAEGALYGRHNDVSEMTEVRKMIGTPTEKDINDLRHFCKTGTWGHDEKYDSFPLGSAESMDVIIRELKETRLYSEVLRTL